VIENYLLHRGEDICGIHKKLGIKELVDMALVVYSLKVNATNRLRVKFDLEKYFMRRNMIDKKGWISVPEAIYMKVKIENDKYRQHDERI